NGRANAAAARGNLTITCATRSLLKFIRANTCENRVRVGIDEARQHDASAGIDHFAIRVDETFDFTATAYCFDVLAAHEHRAVFNDRELSQVSAGARAPRPGKRD